MGLDIAAGILVLLGAVRGYFQGLLIPSFKLMAMLGAVFLADPLRDFAIPRLQPHFPSIQESMFTKIVWWASFFISYWSTSALGCSLIRLAKTRPAAGDAPQRGGAVDPDKTLGFCFGGGKSLLLLAVFVHLLTVKTDWIPKLGLENILAESHVYSMLKAHDPFARIWTSDPVVKLRDHLADRGGLPISSKPKPTDERTSDSESLSAESETVDPKGLQDMDFEEAIPPDDASHDKHP